jgi:glycosyltransferase involved in cell wall biosynthesis
VRVDRVMFIVNEFPLPVRSGAHRRSCQLIAAAQAGLASVSVFSLSQGVAPDVDDVRWYSAPSPRATPAELARRSLDWRRVADGHPSDYLWNPDVAASLIQCLEEVQPDLVILEELHTRRAIEVLQGRVGAVVYDSFNVLTSLVDELVDESATAPTMPRALSAALSAHTRAAEAAVVRAVDQVWVCSASDRDLMTHHFPGGAPIVVVPNTVDAPVTGARPQPSDGILRIAFSASFVYPPNARAAAWLARALMPALRASHPEAELLLIGSGPSDVLRGLVESGAGITATGPVLDTGPHVAGATAAVVPVHQGGGTRFKVLEAMSLRVPVVSTAKGVEGLDMVPGAHYVRAETTIEFVDVLIRLHRDGHLRHALTDQAFEHVRARFSFDQAKLTVAGAFADLHPRTPIGPAHLAP